MQQSLQMIGTGPVIERSNPTPDFALARGLLGSLHSGCWIICDDQGRSAGVGRIKALASLAFSSDFADGKVRHREMSVVGFLRWLVVLTSSMATSVGAETPLTYTDGGTPLFSIEVPDFWTVRTGGVRELMDTEDIGTRPVNRIIGLKPEDDDAAWMGFVAPRGVSTFAEGRDYLRDIAKHIATEPEVEQRRTAQIGGRAAEIVTAVGKRDGRSIQITA
ncbi:MAG: hypothetical protein AAGB07_18485, partial [Pseudomonadota bacterium]